MKKKHEKSMQFAKSLAELKDGKLEGGFEFIAHNQLINILGGTNNCNGGNCVANCGQVNNVEGCGTTNTVAGCGTPPPSNG